MVVLVIVAVLIVVMIVSGLLLVTIPVPMTVGRTSYFSFFRTTSNHYD